MVIKRKLLAVISLTFSSYCFSAVQSERHEVSIPAIKLINTEDNKSSVVRGTIESLDKISAQDFYFSNTFEEWQKGIHPAPKRQYVVTMKGKLKFRVSNGDTFIVEPGTVLLAEDTSGEGHSWEIIDGDEWMRVYIPMADNVSHFKADPVNQVK